MTNVYIAGPFSWRDNLAAVAHELGDRAVIVTSRWMTAHAPHGDNMDAYSEDDLATYGREDLEDIDVADVVVLFNPGTSGGGGRWVEMGYALAKDKPLVVVGQRTNPFCYDLARWCGEMRDTLAALRRGDSTAAKVVADALMPYMKRAAW